MRSRPAATGSETGALGRRGSRAPIGNDTQDGARRRASGGQPWGLKTSSAADEGLTGGSWVWFVFFGGGHVGTLEARRLATPWPVAHDGDDANDGGEGGTARLPFCAADSPRDCGRIMPRAACGWTDRAMQRSFPLPGASRRLEAQERKEATAAVPHRSFIGLACTAHPTEGARQRGGRCQKQEARSRRLEGGRGKEEGAEALT